MRSFFLVFQETPLSEVALGKIASSTWLLPKTTAVLPNLRRQDQDRVAVEFVVFPQKGQPVSYFDLFAQKEAPHNRAAPPLIHPPDTRHQFLYKEQDHLPRGQILSD